jgi:hypothetical protein
MKNLKNFFITVILIIGVLIVYFLLIQNPGHSILNTFTQYIQSVIALSAFIISIVSILIAGLTLNMQRKHNRLSVKPIPNITEMNYVDSGKIGLSLENVGIGPMIIKKIKSCKGETVKKDPFEWLPEGFDHILTDYTLKFEGTAIPPMDHICLLYYDYDPKDNKSLNNSELIRSILAELEINVEYADVYDQIYEYNYHLVGFGESIRLFPVK